VLVLAVVMHWEGVEAHPPNPVPSGVDIDY